MSCACSAWVLRQAPLPVKDQQAEVAVARKVIAPRQPFRAFESLSEPLK